MSRHVTKKSTTSKGKKSTNLGSLKTTHAGIDIGARSIFVCIATTPSDQVVREFSTFTPDLKAMVKWLRDHKVESVAMESTGVYWIPVYDIIEESGMEAVLVNARHLKNIPARKTDVKDCQWIQELHSYGLLRGSFRPERKYLVLRTLVRQRSHLFSLAASQVQLMQKALTQMNVQIHLVMRDITGATGQKIIRDILGGVRNPEKLAQHRHKSCKRSEKEIAKALEGTYQQEHVFALKQSYEAYLFFHRQVMDCEKKIEEQLKEIQELEGVADRECKGYEKSAAKKTVYRKSPYHFDVGHDAYKILGADLSKIPGIDGNTAIKILSEIGTDMSKWKSVKHFCSWMGLCPGSKISGGKVLSSRSSPTKNRVAAALRLAANTLYNSQTALGAFFRRMRSKFGAPKAITAVAHKMARMIYTMLTKSEEYYEFGATYYEEKYRSRVVRSIERRAREFGYELVPSKG